MALTIAVLILLMGFYSLTKSDPKRKEIQDDFRENVVSKFKCIKCGTHSCEKAEIRVTGGFVSKLFDIQSEKFKTLSCKQCGYTEMYARPSSTTSDVIDLIT